MVFLRLIPLFFCAAALHAQDPFTIERIAVDRWLGGDAQFDRITRVATNDFSQLAVTGAILGSEELGLSGGNLWLYDNGVFTPFIRIGDTVSGITDDEGGELKYGDALGQANITNSGRVTFRSPLDNIFGNELDHALWEGQPFTYGLATRSKGVLPDPMDILNISDELLLNDLGDVVFQSAQFQDAGAIWLARSVQDLTMIAEHGGEAPNKLGEPLGFLTFATLGDTFKSLSLTPNGDIVFKATLSGLGVEYLVNDEAIFRYKEGQLKMLTRLGDAVPGNEGLTFTRISDPTAGSAAPVVFAATHSDSSSGLWSVDQAEPNLLVTSGVPVETSEGVIVFETFDRALQGANETLVFYASDETFGFALWRITDYLNELEREISLVTNVESYTGNLTLNSVGKVAFEGSIPGLTGNGLWVEDAEGNFGLAVKVGQLLETQPEQSFPVLRYTFSGDTGGEDGRPTGFSANGLVVFVAQFGANNISNGIYQAGVVGEVLVTDFVWTGDCDDENWVSFCLDVGNWEANDGTPTISYPGKSGDNNTVLIGIDPMNPISLDNFPETVTIKSIQALNSSGIELLSDLIVREAYEAETVKIKEAPANGAHKLSLSGTGEIDYIYAERDGVLEIGSDGDLTSFIIDIRGGQINMKPNSNLNTEGLIISDDSKLPIGSGTIVVNSESRIHISEDVSHSINYYLKSADQSRLHGELPRTNLILSDTQKDFQWSSSDADFTISKHATISDVGESYRDRVLNFDQRFIIEGDGEYRPGTVESEFHRLYGEESHNPHVVVAGGNSFLDFEIESLNNTWRFQRGMEVSGWYSIFLSNNIRDLTRRFFPPITLAFTDPHDIPMDIEFAPDANLWISAVRDTPEDNVIFGEGVDIILPASTLILHNVRTTMNGTVLGDGILEIDSGGKHYFRGQIGRDGVEGNVRIFNSEALFLHEETPFEITGSLDIETGSDVEFERDLRLDGATVITRRDERLGNHGSITFNAENQSLDTIFVQASEDGGQLIVDGILRFERGANYVVDVPLDLTGTLSVRNGQLNLNGPVAQIQNDHLTDGTWEFDRCELLLPENSFIRHIDEEVTLSLVSTTCENILLESNSGILRIEGTHSIDNSYSGINTVLLERNLGEFVIQGSAVLTTAANLLNRGSIKVEDRLSVLTVPGTLQSFGEIKIADSTMNVGQLRAEEGTTIQLEASAPDSSPSSTTLNVDGELILNHGSEIVGEGNINAGSILLQGGSFRGTHILATDAMLVQSGDVDLGSSPGSMTLTGDYSQEAMASLLVELADGDAGTDYDLLDVSGTATLGGTLKLLQIGETPPSPDSVFEFIKAETVVGTFDKVVNTFQNRVRFDIAYNTDSVTATTRYDEFATYSEWAATHFTSEELVAAVITEPLQDGDGDGVSNAFEYGMALRQGLTDDSPLSALEMVEETGDYRISFPWDDKVTDATINLQYSNDLVTWIEADDLISEVPVGGTVLRTYAIPGPEDDDSFFVRLLVDLVTPQ